MRTVRVNTPAIMTGKYREEEERGAEMRVLVAMIAVVLLMVVVSPVWATYWDAVPFITQVGKSATTNPNAASARGKDMAGDRLEIEKDLPFFRFPGTTKKMLYIVVDGEGSYDKYSNIIAGAMASKLGRDGRVRNATARLLRPGAVVRPGDWRMTFVLSGKSGTVTQSQESGSSGSDRYSYQGRRRSSSSACSSGIEDRSSQTSAKSLVYIRPIVEEMAEDGQYDVVPLEFARNGIEESRLIALSSSSSSYRSRSYSTERHSDSNSSSSHASSSTQISGDIAKADMQDAAVEPLICPIVGQLWRQLSEQQMEDAAIEASLKMLAEPAAQPEPAKAETPGGAWMERER